MLLLKSFSISSFIALAVFTSFVQAEERQAQDYINAAKEYLPFSCKGLADYVEDDEAHMEEAVGYLLAVSIINRKIDIKSIIQTEDETRQFEEDMATSIRKICEADVDTLMAAAVDQAVVKAFSE